VTVLKPILSVPVEIPVSAGMFSVKYAAEPDERAGGVNVVIPVTPTAPEPMVTAPVEVKKVPVLPEKLLAPEPEAVKPLAMTGVVMVGLALITKVLPVPV
jgi:hypothetical protein